MSGHIPPAADPLASILPRNLPAPPGGSVPPSPVAAALGPSALAGPKPVVPSLPNPYERTASPSTPAVSYRPPHPVHAALERSDTLSSVKSLDRSAFSSRPLPRPPVVVNTSRSLDRGVPTPRGQARESSSSSVFRRKQPSVVREESEELHSDRETPAVPSINLPGDSEPISPSKSPAKFSPLPSINIPDSDSAPTTDDESSGPVKAPGIVLSGIPTIAVSSSDTADDDDGVGPLIIAVPALTLSTENDPDATPRRNPVCRSAAPERIEATSAILCAGCGEPIIGRILSAMGHRWHPQCFKCDKCGHLLEHVSSYEHEGRAYCHLDYHEQFAHQCHHCKTPIVDDRFITLNDAVLGQRYYHELHFFCSECGDPFLDPSRSSAPGTEASRPDLHRTATGGDDDDAEGEGEGETNAFVIHKGHPYCERCHLRLHKPKCKACARPIPDVALSAMGAKWHAECFVCQNCAQPFANNLFFPNDGKAVCTECYERIAG
ncbi:hypothetical protein Q5752_005220 [Cryptotrichosporon argae]